MISIVGVAGQHSGRCGCGMEYPEYDAIGPKAGDGSVVTEDGYDEEVCRADRGGEVASECGLV